MNPVTNIRVEHLFLRKKNLFIQNIHIVVGASASSLDDDLLLYSTVSWALRQSLPFKLLGFALQLGFLDCF
jgi:hypothetical protein